MQPINAQIRAAQDAFHQLIGGEHRPNAEAGDVRDINFAHLVAFSNALTSHIAKGLSVGEASARVIEALYPQGVHSARTGTMPTSEFQKIYQEIPSKTRGFDA